MWSEAYQYDARGAPTRQEEPSGRVWTTALGSGGRIVSRSDGTVIERQHYDGAGQLSERHDGLGGVVKLRYDGAGRVRAIEEAGVLVLAIERNHTGEVVRRVYGDPADPLSPAEHSLGAWRRSPAGQVEESLSLGGRTVARIVDGDWQLILPDPGGTPEVVLDEFGAVRAKRAWGVYGAPRSAVGVEARGLHGHRIEAGLGLLDAGARHLVGGLGQFGQVEPLLLEGPGGAMLLDPLRMSAYRYGLNAPTSFVDRDGRTPDLIFDPLLAGYQVGTAIVDPTTANILAAGADLFAVALPLLPAIFGLGVRNADEVMEVINTFGKVSDPAATAAKAAPPMGAVPTPKSSTLSPGPYAGDSIPASGPSRQFTEAEREAVNAIGQKSGCHTCGSLDPGTKSGNFIPDHQPPSRLAPEQPQQLYPQCQGCSRRQGGEVNAELKREPSVQ